MRDQRASGHGHHDVVRQAPAELFGDFVAHGLRAFRVIGPQVHVHKSPVEFLRDLRAQPVHLIVVARDPHQLRAEDLRAGNFCRLKVGGNENPRVETFARGLRGHGICQIARRRAAHHLESKPARRRQSHRHHAILEGEGGEADGIVLHVEIAGSEPLAQVTRFHQRRKACRERALEAFGEGKQAAVAPQIRGSGLDILARKDAANGFQIIR